MRTIRTTIPCPICGYHAPGAECPHCGGAPRVRSLARPSAGPLGGILDGLLAVPMGLLFLLSTRGTKRWLVPPLLFTLSLLVAALWWVFSASSRLMGRVLPGEIELGDGTWEWLEGLSERWDWLKSTWAGLAAGAEWALNAVYGLLTSQPLKLLGYFLVGSLVVWYCFSIAYEALSGPFLDEVQGRLEKRWFGEDPRSRLERPNDIPPERCASRTAIVSVVAAAILLLGIFTPWLAWWLALPLALLPFLAAGLLDRDYGEWLVWVASIEGRATWVSLKASVVTAVLLVLALPLYFVPAVGYFLFAGVCGFATAVSLLDIPLERRGLHLRQRLRLIFRNTLPMIAFGVVAGLLLSIPLIGAVLMVPAASVGGLWLICRLDKSHLRPAEAQMAPPPGGGASPPRE